MGLRPLISSRLKCQWERPSGEPREVEVLRPGHTKELERESRVYCALPEHVIAARLRVNSNSRPE